ncbi:MAG: tRNA uridine-5-carboxymethylaminomethyl(34) synthesis enzyme MnmG [Planctomycetota bacterium]
MSSGDRQFDVIVIGGGHAGVEAAHAAANIGVRTALVTLDPSKIGVMSCNPAIGGLGKGQMVREIDAMGGIMGLAADATGIMFKLLNTSKGPAVRGPRAQCDKHAYARAIQNFINAHERITVIPAACDSFVLDGEQVTGVRLGKTTDDRWAGAELRAPSVVLTTGTFMRGLMHTGETKTPGGRAGEAPAVGISKTLADLGFELGRLKTGTPPRLRMSTLDWDAMDPQFGDERPVRFSDMTNPTRFPAIEQVECRITYTNERIHKAIRANLHRAPMYRGDIESVGPRYCPSIEDKVVRFADKPQHQVFLEPESLESDWVYCNGISSSLPQDVQREIVANLPACEHAEILQFGYAVEYDMVRPHQIEPTCETKRVRGLYFAGQINGTSGYEEAAGQGLLAGVNAAHRASGDEPVTLGRDEAYIGVMMDDLVTKTPVEPYRMFTSRAEHRLMLRSDNAADRLTERARAWGVVNGARWKRFERRRDAIRSVNRSIESSHVAGEPLTRVLKRPGYTLDDLARDAAIETRDPVVMESAETVLAERQYEGYIRRQRAEAKRQADMERRRIPQTLDYTVVEGLRNEAREVLHRFRPSTFGVASRLEGVTPADLSVLMVATARLRRASRGF